ncbi:MAG: hypothetical protein KGL98_10360 [Gammaproteobacteria bacterium]|nr:hypothetical protein [Gammaproteobacteria bacterium]
MISSRITTEYRHNILADGQIVAVHTITGNGSAYTDYLHYDHLGSVDAITNDSGSVIQTMSFDAFGQRRDATNWDYDLSQNTIATLKNYTDRGYTDQEELDNLSLVDLNGRVYDPTVGRMISADPTIPAPLFSQAFNRYSYVYNSPFEYADPRGYDPTQNPAPGFWYNGPDGWGFYSYFASSTPNPYTPYAVQPQPTQPATTDIALGAVGWTQTVTVAPTNVGAPNGTGTAATPVGTGGTSPIQTPWLAPISPPGPCQCNIGGDNQVGNIMDNTDGAQTCDENCFGLIAQYASPTITDTRRNPDGPGNVGGDPNLHTPPATPWYPARPGVGPMRPSSNQLGTMGTPQPLCGPCLKRLAQTPPVFKAVGAGAAAGATIGTGVATYGIMSKGLAIAAEESEIGDTLAATLTATEVLSDGGIAGLSVGGPIGALGGALIGLAIYGGYVLYEHETTKPAPQPVSPSSGNP